MTFEKAYCQELDANITAYKARRAYFSQEDSDLKYHFFCPDEKCNVEMTAVNVYTVGKYKQRPHFRTKANKEHSKDCTIVHQDDTKNVEMKDGESNSYGSKLHVYPDEFILNRPKKELHTNAPREHDEDDEFDVESRKPSSSTDNKKHPVKHSTSFLENVVDSYERMTNDEAQVNRIKLYDKVRSYKNTFKNIKYFTDGKDFIFYGQIKPIQRFGKNYAIKFEDNVFFNEHSYSVSIYIEDSLISSYRLRRLFKESIDALADLGNQFKSATCYFVGAYPELKTIHKKDDSTFDVLEVKITNLDHLVIKFTE